MGFWVSEGGGPWQKFESQEEYEARHPRSKCMADGRIVLDLLNDSTRHDVIGTWTAFDSEGGPIERAVKKAAKKRRPLSKTLLWESIPEAERTKLLEGLGADLRKIDDTVSKYVNMPERAVAALEGIAKSQAAMYDFFQTFFHRRNVGGDIHEIGGQRSPKVAEGTGRTDPRNTELEPVGKESCTRPEHRFGINNRTGRAVCAVMCGRYTDCPIPHEDTRGALPPNQSPAYQQAQNGSTANDFRKNQASDLL